MTAATLTPESIARINDIVDESRRAANLEADRVAAVLAAELAVFDRTPKAFKQAQARAQVLSAKVAQAEADVAVAKAEKVEAEIHAWQMGDALTRELCRLRRGAIARYRLDAALELLLSHAEQYQTRKGASADACGRGFITLMRAVQFLTGLRDGVSEPPTDLDEWVQAQLTAASVAFHETQKEFDRRQRDHAKAERTRKIFNPAGA